MPSAPPSAPCFGVHAYRVGGATRLLAFVLLFVPTLAAPAALGELELRITCARTGPAARGRDGVCAIEHKRVLSGQRQELPLASVLRARADRSLAGRASVVLVTAGADVVASDDLPEEAAAGVARDVNAFLASPGAPALDVRVPRAAGLAAFYALLSAALALAGALAYRSAPRVHVELDPDLDVVRVVRRLWPFRPYARSTARADVAEAVVEGIPEGEPARFRVTLVTRAGDRAPLTRAYYSGDRAPHDALAAAIRAFVRAP